MKIVVEGEDENRTDHRTELELDVKVDKERHELRFLRTTLSPEKLSCATKTQLRVDVINTGEEDEEEVLLLATAPVFELNERETFNLFEDIDDDDNEYSFTTEIDAANIPPGIYPITTRVEYDGNDEVIEKTLELEVEECARTTSTKTSTKESEKTSDNSVDSSTKKESDDSSTKQTTSSNTNTKSTTQSQPTQIIRQATPSRTIPQNTAVATPRTSYSSSGWLSDNKWIILIVISDIILLIVGIVVVLSLLKRKKRNI